MKRTYNYNQDELKQSLNKENGTSNYSSHHQKNFEKSSWNNVSHPDSSPSQSSAMNFKSFKPSSKQSQYDIPDHKAQQVLNRMVRCNTLTICSQKAPEYYLKLIRHHFSKSDDGDTLSLQSLGHSCQNLVYVACLVTMKGYAFYKKIKNDHLSVPVADSKTGAHLGLLKKVRLTVKLTKSADFNKIIQDEEEKFRFENQSQPNGRGGIQVGTRDIQDRRQIVEEFDQEDLVLKSKQQIEEEEKNVVIDEEEAKREMEIYKEFEEDPNFQIDEEDESDDENQTELEDQIQEGEDLENQVVRASEEQDCEDEESDEQDPEDEERARVENLKLMMEQLSINSTERPTDIPVIMRSNNYDISSRLLECQQTNLLGFPHTNSILTSDQVQGGTK
ncbi:UNKNOWN [Stylonychia lemnae]|uniref:Uncharacterized protein n=1 Tax=Stylonychia lemnae TaxID=5949 RepID=A0A078AZ11_STYLE|nr:UNKNOWN [Stylonychia lemnae]|eukprot:CDW86043.1 UNKNOWN [Stylonychia lemnae]